MSESLGGCKIAVVIDLLKKIPSRKTRTAETHFTRSEVNNYKQLQPEPGDDNNGFRVGTTWRSYS